MNKIIGIFFLSLLSLNLFAQKTNKIPPPKPKLIVSIVVEQMKPEFLNRYWKKFDNNGFKRFFYQGTTFKYANYNYMLTQTAPGITTIVTGCNPSQHGIISDKWIKRINNKKEDCVNSKKYKQIGFDKNYDGAMPKNILTSTISDELKINTPESKVYSISLDKTSAVLAGGHIANASFWFNSTEGKFTTSSYYLKELPKWVKKFNNKGLQDIYMQKTWETLLPIEKYTESFKDSNIYEFGIKHQITFPYDLLKLSGNTKKNITNYKILTETPYGNTLVHDMAISTILDEELGKDNNTDFLSVTFSATKNIDELYGNKSIELEDTYLRLDKDIAHLIDFINQQVGKQNVLIYLTSDHGVSDNPEYLKAMKIPAGRFKHNYSIALLRSYLNAIYGEADWISAYMDKQIYLNRNLIEDSKIDLNEIQQRIANFIIQYDAVANALTSTTLLETSFNEGLLSKMQNSFNQKRSGDIIINLMPGFIEDKTYLVSSNSGYNYDTNVPLYFYGWKTKRNIITRKVNMEDIAPTLSLILNIPFPNGTTGQPIKELLNK